MKLTRLIITGILTGMVAVGCSNKEGRFSVTGKITHAEGQTIYLEELQVASTKPLDSVKINKNGEFIFYGQTSNPAFYLLKLNPAKFITLLIDSLEEVRIEADAANFGRNYQVEGSVGSTQVKILNDYFLNTRKKLDSLQSL